MWNRFTLAHDQAGQFAAVSRIPGSMETWWVSGNGSVQGAYWYEDDSWHQYELAPAGSASPAGGIAAVSRMSTTMEVWWIGANGSVRGAFWYEGGSWQHYELAPAGSASPTGSITALSRIPNTMEVWWVGADGSVQDAYWYEGATWQRFALAPAGSASTSGGISAVSRIPDSMELWWVGADGSVQDAYWYDGGAWGRFTLAPAGSASLTGSITGVSRIPDSMEVWWVGADGSVQDAYWYEGTAWQRFTLAAAGSASKSGGISAVSRISNTMELWWVGADGSIQDAYWYDGGTWQQFPLAPAGSASETGGIAVVSRIPGSMELWWGGEHGTVQDANWYSLAWQRFTLALPPGAADSAPVAAVSRIPNSMEMWWVGEDGSVQDAYWYEGAKWEQFTLAGAQSAAVDGGIAAVSRIPGSMEVWWIGSNGSVQGAFWYEGGSWQHYELAPVGSASPTGSIAAVSRISGTMEVWWIGSNGSVQGAFWYEGGSWQHYELAPVGSASATGSIAAVSRIPGSMEVWWIGVDGSVQDAYWYEGGAWGRFTLAPTGSATPGGSIAAVSRIPGSMEIWWVGLNGSVQGAYWYDGGSWRQYELAPTGSAALTGSITAVSRIPGSMEVWWVGDDKSVQDAYWYEGGAWGRFTLAPAGSASKSTGIAAVSRIPSGLEVWWVGADGSVQDAFWYDHAVTLNAIEVTQSIQDLAQSVPLVGGKPTVVRAYAGHPVQPGARVWATLTAQRPGGRPITLRSRAAVNLDPARAGDTAALRRDSALSMNFVVPGFLTAAGQLTVSLSKIVDEATGVVIGGSYTAPTTVTFGDGHPLRVHVVSVRYSQQVNPPPAPPTTFAPTQTDLDHLRSWLGRAYPTSQVIWSTAVVDSNTAAPFTSDDTNAQLAALRTLDMAAGGDRRTHYYGMVADGGFFMRGSAAGIPATADPSVVASGPTGVPSGSFGWDTDGTYGDWYGGHELGHTFGRMHPGFCGETHDDTSYPYIAGQLADDDAGCVGYDVGDPWLGLGRTALPGTQWHDIMTYCPSEWLSDYTYRGIMTRLATEDGLAAGAGPVGGSDAMGGQDDIRMLRDGEPKGHNTISVVANINLTTGGGKLTYVTPVPGVPATAPAAGSPVVVVFEDAEGHALTTYPVLVRLNTELDPGDDRIGLVNAVIPVDPEARAAKLIVNGEVVDSLQAAEQPPDLRAVRRPALEVEGSTVRLSWDDTGGGLRHTVQASSDGGRTWRTVAVGVTEPSVAIDRSQFTPGQTVQLRVIATDGFTLSEILGDSFTA